jgi:acyl-CoA synthetase (AMP-forming)/AMP-acid ligase II
MNITEAFAAHARSRPNHAAIEDGERIVTYAELEALADCAAANLLKEGIARGDIVALALPDSIEHVALLWALARIGAAAFPINMDLLRSENEVGLGGHQLKSVIVAQDAPTALLTTNVPLLKNLFVPVGNSELPAAAAGGRQPLCCVQSSGTTGTPKTFVKSHAQMIASFHSETPSLCWTAEDRYLALIRLSFSASSRNCLAALFAGATIILDHSKTADELNRAIRDRRVTVTTMTPLHLRPMLAYAAGNATCYPLLRSLRVVTAAITAEELALARERLTPNVVIVYGANELSWISVASPADQDAYPGTVGLPVPGVEAEIVDHDRQPVPPGEVGLLRLRSDCAATGYLDDPVADARNFQDGWFYPMDLATINDDGYIFLKGRADDLISVDGIKFYPVETEAVLLRHPAVRDAAVFGWPHPLQGQVTVAAVTTDAPVTRRGIKAFCVRHLAPYKVPRIIMLLDEMPRTSTGKILKRRLKEKLRQKIAERRAKF